MFVGTPFFFFFICTHWISHLSTPSVPGLGIYEAKENRELILHLKFPTQSSFFSSPFSVSQFCFLIYNFQHFQLHLVVVTVRTMSIPSGSFFIFLYIFFHQFLFKNSSVVVSFTYCLLLTNKKMANDNKY